MNIHERQLRHLADLTNGYFLVISLNFGICNTSSNQHILAMQINAGGLNFTIRDISSTLHISDKHLMLQRTTTRLKSLRSLFDFIYPLEGCGSRLQKL